MIRVPVIPTFNDTVEEIQGIARFADTLPGVDKIHLLPYHRLGQDKYEGLGRPYLMGDMEPPSKEQMETLKKAVHAVSGLDCQIGGLTENFPVRISRTSKITNKNKTNKNNIKNTTNTT